jgi:hypothetical protein
MRSVDHVLPFNHRTLKVPITLARVNELALIDSGVTGYFIDKKFVKKNGLKTTRLLFLVMDTGVPWGIFSQPAPAPVQISSRNYGYGIPTQTGTGSKGTHRNGNLLSDDKSLYAKAVRH